MSFFSAAAPVPSENKQIDQFIEGELECHTCAVCYEVMEAPDKVPILLFPCGHTFCKPCLDTHIAKSRTSTCPLCRAKIQSQAVNFSLQHLITSLASKQKQVHQQQQQQQQLQQQQLQTAFLMGGARNCQSLSEALSGPHGPQVQHYLQQYRMFSMRCQVLGNRAQDLEQALVDQANDAKAARLVVDHLKQEEGKVQIRIRELEAELSLLKQHISQQQHKADSLAQTRSTTITTLEQVRLTLTPLEQERDKSRLLLSNFVPEAELERL